MAFSCALSPEMLIMLLQESSSDDSITCGSESTSPDDAQQGADLDNSVDSPAASNGIAVTRSGGMSTEVHGTGNSLLTCAITLLSIFYCRTH